MRMRPRRARRQFRRLARGLFGGPGLGLGLSPAAIQALNQANGLLGAGGYDEAADMFAQLADGAEEHGMPRRAAHMRAQAAYAQVQAGDPAQALEQARRGVGQLITAGRPRQARRMAERIAEALRSKGYATEANSLLGMAPAVDPAPGQPAAPAKTLPAKCPQCGGAARSDEVEWVDAATAECAFCGAVIKAA